MKMLFCIESNVNYHQRTMGQINIYGTEPTITTTPLTNNKASIILPDSSILDISISEPKINSILKMNITHRNFPDDHNFIFRITTYQNDNKIFHKSISDDRWPIGGGDYRYDDREYHNIKFGHLLSNDPIHFSITGYTTHNENHYKYYQGFNLTTDTNPAPPDPPRTLERPPVTSTQEKDREITELRS